MSPPITRRIVLSGLGTTMLAACTAKPAKTSIEYAESHKWIESVPLPFPVQEIYPCRFEGRVHQAGGFIAEHGRITGPTAMHIAFDPANPENGWIEQTPLPVARHHPHLVGFGGGLFAFAGFESPSAEAGWTMQSSGWRLDGGEWVPAPKLPAPCGEAVMEITGDGSLHLAGGRTPNGAANANWPDHGDTNHHFVLSAPDSQWEAAAPCPTSRNSAAAGVIAGNLHIIGGRQVNGVNLDVHEVYDCREDRWRTAAPMPQAQGGLAAAALGGRLFACGGEYFSNGGGVYPEAWAYDPASDAWTALPNMPTPRHGLGAVALDGDIYVIGGAAQASGNDTRASVEIFRP